MQDWSRLVEKVDVSTMGLGNRDRSDLIELLATSEDSLGARRIEEYFQPSFFKTNFWYMWCTTFAFQPWHSVAELKRYLHRFIQEFPRISTLAGVRRTAYNQYDSIVRPVTKWLKERGVCFVMQTQVTDLDFIYTPEGRMVKRIHYIRDDNQSEINVNPQDFLFVTIGSMVAGSSIGSMTTPPAPMSKNVSGSWALWETIVKKYSDFGKPSAFDGNIDQLKWLSFTTTLHDPAFFNLMERFTENKAGTGGLVTIIDSNWLMSVVLGHQPHFIGQPANTDVFWGYGLFPDEKGNYVQKKMAECRARKSWSSYAIISVLTRNFLRSSRLPLAFRA